MVESDTKKQSQELSDALNKLLSFSPPKPKVGFAFDNYMLLHQNSPGHQERPSRLMSIYTYLEQKELFSKLQSISCKPIDPSLLLLTHTQQHVDFIIQSSKTHKDKEKESGSTIESTLIEPDVYTNKYTARCALMSAGCAISSVDSMFEGDNLNSVFAAIRPPGHHASCQEAAGFCFFNNVVLATKYAQKYKGVKKVCIFDWDIHCGDGTSKLTDEDDSILLISIHKYNNGKFYPGPYGTPQNKGKGKGEGFNMFFGFDTSDQNKNGKVNDYDYIYACDNVFFPMIREFKPDMIIVSCGFDSALGDPLGGIAVTPAGYAWMTAGLMKMAPKMMVVLEGGYNLEALAKSSYAVVQTLIIGKVNNEFVKMLKSFVKQYDEEVDEIEVGYEQLAEMASKKVRESFINLSEEMKKEFKQYWKCFQ